MNPTAEHAEIAEEPRTPFLGLGLRPQAGLLCVSAVKDGFVQYLG